MPLRPRIAAALLLTSCLTPISAQQVIHLWPHGAPEPTATTGPEIDVTKDSDNLINGHRSVRLTNVSDPTITIYSPPPGKANGAAALVFPGGGYTRLAWTGEGTDACDWLNSVGMTCLLVKYRVPQPLGEAGHYPADPADLEDAQQAMRLARRHAGEWHIDPNRIGVVGFSAGGNLAVLLSTHPDDSHIESTSAAQDIPKLTQEASGAVRLNGGPDARPNFAIVVYPAYLALDPDQKDLNPVYTPNQFTPPTFLIAAENDLHYGRNAPVYYRALTDAKIPAELHMYATGGHGFGVHPPNQPEEHWTHLADIWLRGLDILPDNGHAPPAHLSSSQPATLAPLPAGTPCPIPNPQPPNQQSSTSTQPNLHPTPDQPCP